MAYDLLTEIEKAPIPTPEHMLGRGSMMPFNGANSGGRKLMFGVNLEQRLSLVNPDVPFLSTGFEYQFGQYSSSITKADDRYVVVGIIPKYSHKPDYHCYYILQGSNGLDLQVVEAMPYKHITEEYGYRVDTSAMDRLNIGSVINAGDTMLKSNAFDEYENRMDGKNLLVRFTACEKTMEDSIRISRSCSKKLASPLIHKIKIVINDNDIPLNLYGDADHYKVFPDVGDGLVINDLVMGYRREKKEESLFIQSYDRLSQLFISDDKIRCAGRVIDIDVYSNDPSKIQGVYFDQIRFYHEQQMIFAQRLVECVQPYIANGARMKYDLQKLYYRCKGVLEGKQYFNERVFSSLNIDITVLEEIPASTGDKLTNRYGGKGVISEVVEDYLMPRTYDGEVFDIEINICGVYGRENGGQLFELTTTAAARNLLHYWSDESVDVGECYNMYLDFLQIVAPRQFEETVMLFSGKSDDVIAEFIGGMVCDGCMYIEANPMSEMLDIDKVAAIYQRFPWMQQQYILVPLKSSTGKIQYVCSHRPVVAGYVYYYRLKQHAKEKFSVTSLSATNIRNENSRNKASKMYKALYSRTPIRFGDMEIGDLGHLSSDIIVQMLMLYATAPMARQLYEDLMTGDPFNIDIRLDDQSSNRNAEIVETCLKTIGKRITFRKVKKQLKTPVQYTPIRYYMNDPKDWDPVIFFGEGNAPFQSIEERRRNPPRWPVTFNPVQWILPPEEAKKKIQEDAEEFERMMLQWKAEHS